MFFLHSIFVFLSSSFSSFTSLTSFISVNGVSSASEFTSYNFISLLIIEMIIQGSYNCNWIDACARLEGFLFITFSYYRSWIEGRSNNKADMMPSWNSKYIQGARGCSDAHHEAIGEAISSNQVASDAATPPMAIGIQRNPSVKPNLSLSWAESRRELPTQAIQQEERETGDLGTQIYRDYISKEWWVFAGMIVANFLSVILQVTTTDVNRCTKWMKTRLITLLWFDHFHLEIRAEQVECWRLSKFHIGCATRLFLVCKMQLLWQNSILK